MKHLKNLFFVYPQQVLLFILNTGLFLTFRWQMANLAQTTGLADFYDQYAPFWMQNMTAGSLERFQVFLETSSWAWLVASIILLILWRWLSKLLRTVFMFGLLILAGWLIWKLQLMV
ncbi:hypothetical protein [Streptococcus moroccensis]|uniref:Uncharacterized protein n=1 Tax=Streptococcus moroccensis TaxID=1451356 RepID=A0ABT9YRH6_9STRE|nr:hypothetical protein [Streptococcus moroccensis]MDQ0221913.1 hypothetical protein [Streptococcus moroccensis]